MQPSEGMVCLPRKQKRVAGKTLTLLIQSLFLGSQVRRSVPMVMDTQFLWHCLGSELCYHFLTLIVCWLLIVIGSPWLERGRQIEWLVLYDCSFTGCFRFAFCCQCCCCSLAEVWTRSQCSDPSDFMALAAFISLLAVGQRLLSLPCCVAVSIVAHSMEACFFKASKGESHSMMDIIILSNIIIYV